MSYTIRYCKTPVAYKHETQTPKKQMLQIPHLIIMESKRKQKIKKDTMKHLAEKLRAMQQVSQHTNDKQCNATTKKLASQKTNKYIE